MRVPFSELKEHVNDRVFPDPEMVKRSLAAAREGNGNTIDEIIAALEEPTNEGA